MNTSLDGARRGDGEDDVILPVAGPDDVEGADPVRVEARGKSEEHLERERLHHHDLLVEPAAEELDVLVAIQ